MSHAQHTPVEHEAPDAWHTHTADERPQEAHAENIEYKSVFFFGIAGFLIIAASVVAIIVYFYWYANIMIHKHGEFPEGDNPAAAIHHDATVKRDAIIRGTLQAKDYPVTRPDAGTVRININDAMKKVQADYSKR